MPSRFWGLKVAAPLPNSLSGQHFMMGTSAAAALASHTAHIFMRLSLHIRNYSDQCLWLNEQHC